MTDLDAIAKRAAEAKARAEMAMARPWAFNLTVDVHDLAADVETLLGRVREAEASLKVAVEFAQTVRRRIDEDGGLHGPPCGCVRCDLDRALAKLRGEP